MKCPSCSTNHSYSSGMRCKCGYRFALDPKRYGLADGRFLAIIQKASSGGTAYFTENQLYTAYAQKMTESKVGCLLVGGIVLLVVAAVIFFDQDNSSLMPFVVGAVGVLALGIWVLTRRRGPPNRKKFLDTIQAYEKEKGPLEQLVLRPSLHEPPPDWPEPDIYDYGVERILIVQHDVLVDVLVRNGVHTSQRALLLSGSGYPDYIREHARTALRENPELPVFFLHDATPEGAAWFNTCSASDFLPWESHPKIDLGLHPQDVENLKRLRPLRPEKQRFALPVDAVPFGILALGLGSAFEQQLPLGALIPPNERGDGSGGNYG